MKSHPSRVCVRWTVLVLLAGFACHANARDRYSYFFNDSNDAILSVQVKQDGVGTWTDVDVAEGIGREKNRKLHLRAAGRGRCLYDVKTTFEQGPVLLHRQMNLCAVATYYPERYRRLAIRDARQAKPMHRPYQAAFVEGAGAISP